MKRDTYVLGQPREGRPALRLYLTAGQVQSYVLFTHFTNSGGGELDHTAWDFRMTARLPGGEAREWTPGDGLAVAAKPEALVLKLSAGDVGALPAGTRIGVQLWIEGVRRNAFPYYDEKQSFILVEDRDE